MKTRFSLPDFLKIPLLALLAALCFAGCTRPVALLEKAGEEEVAGKAEARPAPPLWRTVELPDAGFEREPSAWDFSAAEGIAKITAEAAYSGTKGLRIESRHDDVKAFILGPRVPVDTELKYRLTWRARVIAGAGTNIYLRFLDERGEPLARDEGRIGGGKPDDWTPGFVTGMPPLRATAAQVMIQRPGFRSPNYVIDVDDVALEATPIVIEAPWPATYKLRPGEKKRLTAADVVGPDGIVYPDFTYAGVPGGIPETPVKVRLSELGVRPGDSIAAVLEKAAVEVAAAGGGAIEIGEGTFYLDEPVVILGDGVSRRPWRSGAGGAKVGAGSGVVKSDEAAGKRVRDKALHLGDGSSERRGSRGRRLDREG